jgi:CheY-like chemotaxis protein
MAAPFRVLVVEDEGLVAMMLEDFLRDLGCEVAGSAATISQALAWIDAGGEADAALLDVNVAGESVFPVADALAAKGVAIAFTTGYGEGYDPRFRNAVVLGKPIRQDRLEAALRGFGFGR